MRKNQKGEDNAESNGAGEEKGEKQKKRLNGPN